MDRPITHTNRCKSTARWAVWIRKSRRSSFAVRATALLAPLPAPSASACVSEGNEAVIKILIVQI